MSERDTLTALPGGLAPADWLDEALLIYREVSLLEGTGLETQGLQPSSTSRFREAGEAAWMLARLRHERQRSGFVPLAIGRYLRDLAKAARIELGPVLAAFGIGDLASQEPAAIRCLARLCRNLEMSVRETFVHLGLGLAEQLGVEPSLMWAARARGPAVHRDSLEESEQALRRSLARGGDAAIASLDALETEVLAAFEG